MAEIWMKAFYMYGLAIVVSLAVAVVIMLIVVTLQAVERKPAAAPQPAAEPVPSHDVMADHVAAIAAAVHQMIGAHRIVHIEDTRRYAEWVVEGRLAHHASHAPPHHAKR